MKLEKGSSMQSNSNLECFLNSTSPIVQSQFLPKSEIRSLNRLWHPWEREEVEFFRLRDLWAFYDELSAYGAGVPIAMDSGETLVQYFVPYLSALQIFTSNSSVHTFRDEGDSGECEIVVRSRDSCSIDTLSDDSEIDKSWEASSSEGGFDQEINNNEEDQINNNSNSNNSALHVNDRLGFLYLQYFEKSAPYGRVPLMDKINSLAQKYPGLMSLRSVDLSPASWMAVAWYPIYHIPMGRTIKDLSTCFLTYHTLSSSFQDMDIEEDIESMSERKKKRKEGDGISLPAFGLASYKMQGNVWISGNLGRDQERLFSLLSVADSWLKQLRVQHHDFIYFTSIRR